MPALGESYQGAFDPGFHLADLSRPALAQLGREYLLMGHLIDRVGLPLAMERFGDDGMTQLSIDEWMGASPVYSARMQRALGFGGDDVGTVFKNLQLDIGAPHQFMDFQFRLDGPDYGEFWLSHCGALMDVEPWGEDRVRRMCHDIEDPTFDATAAATNPRMKMRPIHRPPRHPAGRYPHCHWSVFIDDEAAPYEQHANLSLVEGSSAGSVPVVVAGSAPASGEAPVGRETGGWSDYSGPFDPGFQLEDLSHEALMVVIQEFAVQAHLLVRSYLVAIAERFGEAAAVELGRRQWVGSAALGAVRLRRALGLEGGGIETVAKVFQLHPHFLPRSYVDLRVDVTGPGSARVTIADCPGRYEADGLSWFAGLTHAHSPALDALAGAIDAQARCVPVEAGDDVLAWDIVVDPEAPPQPEPPELALARMSTGADFELIQRRPLRVTAE
jgi:hypothetical protein